MDDALLMCMLHGRADPAEQVQTLEQPQVVLVAVTRERDALDQLHHEERPAAFGRPGVEELGDVRVVHERQGLPLRLEPGQHGLRVEPRLDQLERHCALHWFGLLGEIDRAHAPLADLLAQLVTPADNTVDERTRRPWFLLMAGRLFATDRRRAGTEVHGGSLGFHRGCLPARRAKALQQRARLVDRDDECTQPFSHLVVTAADLVKVGSAFARIIDFQACDE